MAVFQERRKTRRAGNPASFGSIDSDASALDRAIAADVLLRHLFVPPAQRVDGIEYAAIYRFAEKHSGGDVIDIYRCGNGMVCFSLTDISGKGVSAALHAGLVKYGARAFASEGQSSKAVLRALNRFYLENDTFEKTESFASVFFARFDSKRCLLTYAAAGHEGLILAHSNDDIRILSPTGPLIGVFEDEPRLYGEQKMRVARDAVLLAVSDGVTEARNSETLYGMEPLVNILQRYRTGSMQDLCCAVARNAVAFAHERVIDDMAVLAVRFG
jgi:sigma-B regulation protein RsbU (phosphoserine phosphatase)